jgi:hypothetical protein
MWGAWAPYKGPIREYFSVTPAVQALTLPAAVLLFLMHVGTL